MSDSDSFIDEVSEEVRRERLFGYLKRYGWIGIVLILALVGGAAWNEWRKAQDAARAQALGDGLMEALQLDDAAARADALDGIAAQGPGEAIAMFLSAAERERAGEAEAAAETLARIAADGSMPEIYRDLARLKWAMVGQGIVPEDDRRAALDALAMPGAPFRTLALEQIALTDLAEGDRDVALDGLRAILEDAETTQGLRDRAQGLIVALGGDLGDGEGAASQ